MDVETLASRYVLAAHAAGCPEDQVRFLLSSQLVLTPTQLRFLAAARLCDRPDGPVEVGYGGARMGGKSHAMVCLLADDGLRQPNLPMLLLRKVGVSGREAFESLLPKTIGKLGRWVPSDLTFRFPNGSILKLGHFQRESDIDKYLGLEYGAIGVEEATTLTKAKRQAIRSCCRSPLGSGWRARTYYTTNPGGVGHGWFRKALIDPFRKRTETDTRFIPSTVDDNPFAPPEYVTFLDGLTGWLKRAWRHGDWDISAGQYFSTFRHSVHVLAEPPDIQPTWDFWLGFDYGWTHPTAATLLARDGDGTTYVLDEHVQRKTLPEGHAAAIKAMVERWNVPLGRLQGVFAGSDVFAKKHRGTAPADDYKAAGLTFRPAVMDRIQGATLILSALGDPEAGKDPTLYLGPRARRLADCLADLQHDEHNPEDVLKVDADEDGQGGDDPYDAFRYGFASRSAPKFKVYH